MEKKMKVTLGKSRIDAAYIAQKCCGEAFGKLAESIDSVCTDSREAEKGTLFCAIKGERVDGHDYIEAAYANGCRAFLCERIPDAFEGSRDSAFITVKDTVRSLSSLAGAYCNEDVDFVVGVTGSVGKTTTKEFVASVFPCDSTYKTRGNDNSTIGLPLSMLEIQKGISCAVLEMGMSARGEIELMSKTAKPDVAIITNIGSSHLEMLGSREGIRDAKLEIVKGLKENGVLLINGDDPMLNGADIPCKHLRVSVKDSSCEVYAENIRRENGYTVFELCYCENEQQTLRIPTLGVHNVYAASFAYAVAMIMGIPGKDAAERLANYTPPDMRQNIYDVHGITIIEDCYNASPESMRAALDVLVSLSKEKGNARRIALLGDMLELGDTSASLHEGVGKHADTCGLDLILTLGDLSYNIALGAKNTKVISVRDRNDTESAANALLSELKTGDILLVKASRGVKAEKVIELLKERLG